MTDTGQIQVIFYTKKVTRYREGMWEFRGKEGQIRSDLGHDSKNKGQRIKSESGRPGEGKRVR